jgi:hypothetical protein
MHVERLDRVVIRVRNIEKCVKELTELLNVKFDIVSGVPLHGKFARVAISPLGVELIEGEPFGIRSIVFKVADLETVKVEMKNKGFYPAEELQIGRLQELIYSLDDVLGVPGRIVFASYAVPHYALIALADKKFK